jgi:hypothetical protein
MKSLVRSDGLARSVGYQANADAADDLGQRREVEPAG